MVSMCGICIVLSHVSSRHRYILVEVCSVVLHLVCEYGVFIWSLFLANGANRDPSATSSVIFRQDGNGRFLTTGVERAKQGKIVQMCAVSVICPRLLVTRTHIRQCDH